MKNKVILIGILSLFLAGFTFAQNVDMHSRWELGNLVFYDGDNMMSFVDAIGPNVFKYINHFEKFDTSGYDDKAAVDSHLVIDGWILTTSEASAGVDTPGVFGVDSAGGVIFLGGGQGDSVGAQIQIDQFGFVLDSTQGTFIEGNITYWGARINFSDDSLLALFAGLSYRCDSILSPNGDVGNAFTGSQTYVGFRIPGDSCILETVTRVSNCETYTPIRYGSRYDTLKSAVKPIELHDSTWIKIELLYDGNANEDSGKVYFFVNDSLEATHTSHIPHTTLLTPSFAVFNDGGAGGLGLNVRPTWTGMYIDWVRAIQIRSWAKKQGK